MIRNVSYFTGQLWINLTRNFLMSAAAMSTAVISLLTLGFFLIMIFNMNKISREITSQLEIRAFVKKDVTNVRVNGLIKAVRALPQVKSIEYVPPEKAIKKLEETLQLRLITNPRDNPLPPALVIRVSEPRHIRAVAEQVGRMEGVEDLKYGETVIQKVMAVSMALKFMGFVLTVLMGIGTLFTIINTIRLTVIARSAEIRTMQLVGATSWFIRWPFLMEGIVFGMAGALVSAIVLSGGYSFINVRISQALPFLLPLVERAEMTKILFVLLCLCGGLMGLAGSYVSVTKFLEEDV
ncbi:MAG: permease-like cell division protein FtsX [bacterium]